MYEHLKKIQENEKMISSGERKLERFFSKFGSSLTELSKDIDFKIGDVFSKKSLGVRIAGLTSEIENMRPNEGETDREFAERRQKAIEEKEKLERKKQKEERLKIKDRPGLPRMDGVVPIAEIPRRDGVVPMAEIPRRDGVVPIAGLPRRDGDDPIPEIPRRDGVPIAGLPISRNVRFDETRNEERYIQDNTITDPKYVNTYNKINSELEKHINTYKRNVDTYEDIIRASKKYLITNSRYVDKDGITRYYDETNRILNKFNKLKTEIQINNQELEKILQIFPGLQKSSKSKQKGGMNFVNTVTSDSVAEALNRSRKYLATIDENIEKLEDILDRLNVSYKIGKNKENRNLDKYKEIISDFEKINYTNYNYSNYEFKRICSLMSKNFGLSSELSGNDPEKKKIRDKLSNISNVCKDVKKKDDENTKKEKERIEKEKNAKRLEKINAENLRKNVPNAGQVTNQQPTQGQSRGPFQQQVSPPIQTAPRVSGPPPTPPSGLSAPPKPPSGLGGPPTPPSGIGGPPTPPSGLGGPPKPPSGLGGPQTDKPMVPLPQGTIKTPNSENLFNKATPSLVDNKKPKLLNMENVVDLSDKNKKPIMDLVLPQKEKLEELTKVMNNEKLINIIRNKNFSEFTDKEIKDIDVVRERFNSFVNDYYQLLDVFYDYKKTKEEGEKEDILMILKKEKQIEQLKNIVLEYKDNLEKFKGACETKIATAKIENIQDSKDREKEFKDVFEYMQGLFKEELKEQKKATRENTKILKEENEIQKEKILLLEDKKKDKSKITTPRKKKTTPRKKPKYSTPTKKKNIRTPQKGKKTRTPKK